jgi:hypothetical protein
MPCHRLSKDKQDNAMSISSPGRWPLAACRTSVPGRHTTSPGTGGTGKRRILVSLLVFGQDHISFTSILRPPRPGLESTRFASHLLGPGQQQQGCGALLACRRGFLWLRRSGRTTRLVDAGRTAEGPATLTADTPHRTHRTWLHLLCSAPLPSLPYLQVGDRHFVRVSNRILRPGIAPMAQVHNCTSVRLSSQARDGRSS